jgi:carbon-monoxide dehydrogenase large subunit
VKYTATRSEAFLSDYQGRDLVTKVELAFDKQRPILAMRADNISNAGARAVRCRRCRRARADHRQLRHSGGDLRSRAVFTNTMPTNAYRSSGVRR